jgi:hypothetical protein
VNILWSHTLPSPSSCEQVWGVYHDDTVHYFKLGAGNTSLGYEIIKHPNQLDNNVIWIELEGGFQLLPTLFSETAIPGMIQPIKRSIQNQMTLAFEPKQKHQPLKTSQPKLHIAEGLLAISKQYATAAEYSSYLWFHDQTAIVFAYQNGDLVFSNSYTSSNIQEHLYFGLLPFHDTKLTQEQFALTVHCDQSQIAAAQLAMHKFVPQVKVSTPQFPWSNNEVPPLLHIVAPLIKLSTCASPVAI